HLEDYLSTLSRPPDCSDSDWKLVKHKTPRFSVSAGKLTRRSAPFPQIVITLTSLQNSILTALHEELGHRGIDETYKRAKLRFWWPNMKRIVKKWIQSCLACQQRSSSMPSELKKATGKPMIFGRVSLDTVYIKAGRWKYLVVARDDLSGWVEAVGMEAIKAKKIAAWFMENWVYRFGVPLTVVVDGGSEFGQEFQNCLIEAGAKVKVTTPYYPEANGMIERGHQAIKDTLAKLCENNGKKWKHYLPLVLFADRISTKRTTGYSPYELLFGQPAILPVDLELENYLGTEWEEIKTTEDLLEAGTLQLENREEIIQQSFKKLLETRSQSIKPLNKKKNIRKPLEPGNLVLTYNKSLDSQWGKLFENKWNGPYRIIAQEKGGAYSLEELDGVPLKRRFAAVHYLGFANYIGPFTIFIDIHRYGGANRRRVDEDGEWTDVVRESKVLATRMKIRCKFLGYFEAIASMPSHRRTNGQNYRMIVRRKLYHDVMLEMDRLLAAFDSVHMTVY
ncbi:hypothetical protein PSHT_13498, partial [Puccinia striiformis]